MLSERPLERASIAKLGAELIYKSGLTLMIGFAFGKPAIDRDMRLCSDWRILKLTSDPIIKVKKKQKIALFLRMGEN